LKLLHKNLFRVGFVRYGAIALVLAASLSLISAPRAAAQSIGDYFDISYDPVEFSKDVIHGDETFYATIRGTATCKQDVPVGKAILTSSAVAEHKVYSTEKTLNSSYTINIEPFPDEAGETCTIEKVIPLQFPPESESGDYDVIGELIEARVKVYFFWYNVTDYLPQSQAMGSVEYIAPEPPTQYTLTINVSGQGTTNPSPGTHTYNEGTEVTITANPASGWAFDHWSGLNNNDINPTTVTMNSNKTVTAYFEAIPATQYTLTLNFSGQGTTNPSQGTHTYNEGTEVTITANPASGWAFDHWSGTNNNDINPTTVTMNSNKTVTAYFDEAVADIFSYYRGLGEDPNVVELSDLVKAANDWLNDVIPPGFTAVITLGQLVQLANEWLGVTQLVDTSGMSVGSHSATMHIADIDMGLTSTWWGWRTYATATVSIADAQDNPVADAIVSGHWEGATPDTEPEGTDSKGRVKLSSNAVWKAANETRFTFTVDEVAKGGWIYNPEANIETTDSIVKESGGLFSSIWLLLKSFIQSLCSKLSGALGIAPSC